MQIEEWLSAHWEDMIEDIQTICRIPSVKEEALPGKPFGAPVYEALQQTLACAQKLGMQVVDCDGYAGHAQAGSGDETIGILGHLDVVPATGEWKFPPFSATISEDRLYARGISDDKGPTIAALYAMAAVQAQYPDMPKRVRLILGCDEESGWADIDYYSQKYPMPEVGFAPDADFPVIYAEKGILHVQLTGKGIDADSPVIALHAGSRINVVPDEATAYLDTIEDERRLSRLVQDRAAIHSGAFTLENDGVGLLLKAKGISAHGSMPHQGKNAAAALLAAVCSIFRMPPQIQALSDIASSLDGGMLDIALHDVPSGSLTMNLGLLQCDREACRACLDIRYPVTLPREEVMRRLEAAAASFGFTAEIVHEQKPLYVAKDDPLVETLQKVYESVTGQHHQPISIGGGTYARALRHGIAFGPNFPGEPCLAHEKNEYMTLKNLRLLALLYARAIEALLQI